MDTLLIVLVIGCALAAVAQVARGAWARSRSVERHRQALGTLADITQRSDGPHGAIDGPSEHQAHVRVIGPSGQISSPSGSLPAPRASSVGAANPSPFRRPSRSAPSVAAMDAVATSANLGRSPDTQVMRSGPLQAPVHLALGGTDEATLPGLPPQVGVRPGPDVQELGLSGEPTRPVPVAQPQMFQFDDMSTAGARSTAGGGSSPRLAKLRMRTRKSVGRKSVGRQSAQRRSAAGVVLAAAAVSVAAAAVGVALDLRSSPGQTAHLQTASKQTPVTTTLPSAPRRNVPTTLPPVTTTLPLPSYPAVLVSSSAGTATYQLSSASASIVVSAKGRCWLEVRANSPLGQIVYEGILEAGQQSSVTGPAWLRVGDPPEVAVRVNGTRMPVPGAAVADPVNLQFSVG